MALVSELCRGWFVHTPPNNASRWAVEALRARLGGVCRSQMMLAAQGHKTSPDQGFLLVVCLNLDAMPRPEYVASQVVCGQKLHVLQAERIVQTPSWLLSF